MHIDIDWISHIIAWVGGIPFGIFVTWLYPKLTRKRKGKYFFTVTYESGIMHFEGQVPMDFSIDEIARQLYGLSR